MDVPKVRRWIDGRILRRRPVYVITGVRVAKTRLSVSWDVDRSAAVEGVGKGSGGRGGLGLGRRGARGWRWRGGMGLRRRRGWCLRIG